jgi:hypothetical protein
MHRHSTHFFSCMAALLLAVGVLSSHAFIVVNRARTSLAQKSALVRTLGLTDLCLFTEASYTRHISQADLSTPFQDAPCTLEHFPSGSLLAPPRHLSGMTTSRMTVTKNDR